MGAIAVAGGMPNNDQSFKDLLAQHRPALLKLALRWCGKPSEAEDLVQDTMVRAIASADRFEAGSNLAAWLTTILHNVFLDRCRQEAKRKHVPITEDQPAAAPQGGEEEDPPWLALTRADIDAAVARLDEDLRRVFQLFEREKKRYTEIAEELRIPVGTVGQQLWRARKQLKALLQERVRR